MSKPLRFIMPEGHLRSLEATLSDAAYEIVSEYTYNVEKDWYTYIERESTFMDWCPIKYVQTNLNHKWFKVGRVRKPVFSLDKTGPDELTVEAFEEDTCPMVFATLGFVIMMVGSFMSLVGDGIARFVPVAEGFEDIFYLLTNVWTVANVVGLFLIVLGVELSYREYRFRRR